MDDQVGQFVQAFGARAKWGQGLMSSRALKLGHAPRFLDAMDGRESDLMPPGVFAGGLAQRFGRFFHVEDVVHYLKRQANVLAVAGECLIVRIARPRADRAQTKAGTQQSAGLSAMDRFEEWSGRVLAFAFQIGDLPG